MSENVFSSGRLLYIDPNLTGSDNKNYALQNQQDLCINVELKTYERSRSLLRLTDKTEKIELFSTNSNAGSITFVTPPTANASDSKTLNTNYTNIHTTFTDKTAGIGSQSIGITSIDIQFDTSYTPQIVINFTDIRGTSLFESMSYYQNNQDTNEKPPYSCFMELPYPVFELTVKGFYGKSVTYQLCLTKFTSKFDAGTGNFTFTGTFLGYTFAFLSDMLSIMLNGIVNTEDGKNKFNSLGAKDAKYDIGYATDKENFNLPTLYRLKELCDSANKEIEQAQSDDTVYTERDEYVAAIQDIDTLNKAIDQHVLQVLIRVKPSYFARCCINRDENDVLIWAVLTHNQILDKDGNYAVEPLEYLQYVNNFKPSAKKEIDESLNYIRSFFDTGKYKTITNLISGSENVLNKALSSEVPLLKKESLVKQTIIPPSPYETSTYANKTDAENVGYFFELKKIKDILANAKTEYQKSLDVANINTKEKNKEIIETTFAFTPSLRNIFKILLAHAETFMDLMVSLNNKITGNMSKRNESFLSNKNNIADIHSSNTDLYPFPAYVQQNNFKFFDEDKWIGDNPSFKYIEEVTFVNNLLDGIILSRKEIEEFNENQTTTELGYIPIHPFDLPYFRDSESKNPYSIIKEKGEPSYENLFSYIIQRMFLVIGDNNTHTNYNKGIETGIDLTKNDEFNKLVVYAKCEANNLFGAYKDNLTQLSLLYNNIETLSENINTSVLGDSYNSLVLDTEQEVIPATYIKIGVIPTETKIKTDNLPKHYLIHDSDKTDSSMSIIVDKNLLDVSQFSITNDYYSKTFINNPAMLSIPLYNKFADSDGFYGYTKAIRNIEDFYETKNHEELIKKFTDGNWNLNGILDSKPPKDLLTSTELKYYSPGPRYAQSPIPKINNDDLYHPFFLDKNYLTQDDLIEDKVAYRALKLLLSMPYSENIVSFVNLFTKISSGSIFELPLLYVLLIAGECWYNKTKPNSKSTTSKIKDFKFDLEEWVRSEGLRTYLSDFFLEWVNDPGKDGFIETENILSCGFSYENIINNYDTLIKEIDKGDWQGDIMSKPYDKGGNIYYYTKQMSDKYITQLQKSCYIVSNSFIRNGNYLIKKSFNFIEISKPNQTKSYINALSTELNKLITDKKAKTLEEEKTDANLRTSEIKLSLYNTLKSINDKWVGNTKDITNNWLSGGGGEKSFAVSFMSDLIDRFQFIDRAYNDIGDELLIKPDIIANAISSNENQSLMDIMSRILAQNKINFLALPSFFNYKNEDDMVDMFKIYSYNESAKMESYGNSFICMYVGDTAKHLDTGAAGNFPSDGFDIKPLNNGTKKSLECEAKDFISEPNQKNNPTDSKNLKYIPAFGVNFGVQNQSIFKGLEASQEQFSESEESLLNTDDITKNAAKRKTFIGQNLFNVWTTRSYETSFEMMGNAQIQPLMYYQLNYVPMYHGVYLIKNVTHSIKPNYMTTKVKGQRMRRWGTPLLNTFTTTTEDYGNSGGSSTIDVTSSQNIAEELDANKIKIAKDFLDKLDNSDLSFFEKKYKDGKRESDYSWVNFLDRIKKMAINIGCPGKEKYILQTIYAECEFNRFANDYQSYKKMVAGEVNKKGDKITAYAASGYNQIIPGTLSGLLSEHSTLLKKYKTSNKTLYDRIIELRNKAKTSPYKDNKTCDTNKLVNYYVFANLSAEEALNLTEVYFIVNRDAYLGSGAKINSAIALYALNFLPAFSKPANNGNNNIILATYGEKKGKNKTIYYNSTTNTALGANTNHITPNTILYYWATSKRWKGFS